MKTLYGLNEETAIQRLAAEQEASDQYAKIRSLALEGFAGAWFDGETQRLHVALSSGDSEGIVARLGALPVAVAWPLAELETLQASIADEETSPLPADVLRTVYIDHPHNRVMVEVEPAHVESARALLFSNAAKIEVRGASERPVASADVRGADGTRNATWQALDGQSHPCSIGVSTADGFYWSGHCGNFNNSITIPSGTALGTVGARGPLLTNLYVDTLLSGLKPL